jgi:hypothetical protein
MRTFLGGGGNMPSWLDVLLAALAGGLPLRHTLSLLISIQLKVGQKIEIIAFVLAFLTSVML